LAVLVSVAWAGPWPDDMAPPHATVAPRPYRAHVDWPGDPDILPFRRFTPDLSDDLDYIPPDVVPYGLVDTVIDMIKDMLKSGVSMKDKMENLVKQTNDAIDEVKDFFDSVQDGNSPSAVLVNEVFDKAIKQIMKVLEMAFDGVDKAFLAIARYADEEIEDMWGSSMLKTVMEKTLKKFYGIYVEKTVEALRKVVEKVKIDNEALAKHWDSFMGRLIDEIERSLAKRRADFKIKLVNRSRRSVEAVPFLPDWLKPQVPPKRSIQDLEDLLYDQNPANYIDECYDCLDAAAPFGLAGDLKDALLKVQEVLGTVKQVVTEFMSKVDAIIQTAKDIRQGIADAAGDKDALEFVMEKVQAEIEKLVLELIDRIMKEVTVVIRGIIEKVDTFLSDKFCPFKEKVFQWLDDVIVSTIDNVLGVLEKALNLLDRIEEGRWDDVIDKVMDIAKGKLNDMFKDLRQHIKDKIASIGK